MIGEGERNRVRSTVILSFIAGVVFIILAAVSRKVGIFLPVGVALIVIGMALQKRAQ